MIPIKKKLTIVVFLLVLVFIPGDVFALEVSYPDWIPIGADQTLVELVVSLFQITLLFSALIAFLAIMYAGIQFILGGSNPGARAGAKERVKAAIIGLIILGSATLLLGTIDPGLIEISDIVVDPLEKPLLMSIDIPFPPAPGFKAGISYAEMLLAQELDESEEILVDVEADLPTILDNILILMEYCGPDRCDPGSGTFSLFGGCEECNCYTEESCTEECDDEGNNCVKECEEEEICSTCPSCTPESCTGEACFGDPLPPSRKTDAATAIGRIPAIIDSMRVKIDEIREAQKLIDGCNADPVLGSLTCSMAYILDEDGKGITAGCEDGLDFFCASDETGRIFGKTHLPVDEFILIQKELLAEFNIIINAIESATCANTTWECGTPSGTCQEGGCSPDIITGLCTWAPPTDYAPTFAATPHTKQEKLYRTLALLIQQLEKIQEFSPLKIHTANALVLPPSTNKNGTGCPDELFEELDKLKEFRDRVQKNSTALTKILAEARESGVLARGGAGIFLVCQNARELAYGIADSETYRETGTCLEGVRCCPSAATLTSLASCYNADMYFCN